MDRRSFLKVLMFSKLLGILLIFCMSIGQAASSLKDNEIVVDGKVVQNFEELEKTMVDGSSIYLGKGTYGRGLVIVKSNVTLTGENAHLNEAIQGKAAIVIKGDNVVIEGISCSNITVADKNGACIRQEGKNLTLINVHFYDSQQGVLQNADSGFLNIKYSLFERLGKDGYAHAVYAQGEELLIESSQFLETKDQGHSIKSRAKSTQITNSIIASKNSNDSRLIDIPNGGILVVRDSILFQGAKTVNREVIGYGLEGIGRNRDNSIMFTDNIVLMERPKGNVFLNQNKMINLAKLDISDNLLVGNFLDFDDYVALNFVYEDRPSAYLEEDELPTLNVLTAFKLGLVE